MISSTSTGCDCADDTAVWLVRIPRMVTRPFASTRAIAASLSLLHAGVACQTVPSIVAERLPCVAGAEAAGDSAVGFIGVFSFAAHEQTSKAIQKIRYRAFLIALEELHNLYRRNVAHALACVYGS